MRRLTFLFVLIFISICTLNSQNVELSPVLSEPAVSTFRGIESQWDVLFNYNLQAITGGLGNAGGVYIHTLQQFWVSRWSTPAGRIYVVSKAGAIVDSFTTSVFTGTRNMCFDGQYVYHGNATNNIYKVDPVTRQTIQTIPLPTSPNVQTRFISYDPTADGGQGGFWVGNWTSGNLHFYLVSRTGALLRTINNTAITGVYGLAFDNWSQGGPYLWAWSQGASYQNPQYLHQILVSTGLATGFTRDVKPDLGLPPSDSSIAGGLFITDQHTLGKVVLGGVMQGTPDRLFGYELVQLATPPLNPFNLQSPTAGVTITTYPKSSTPVTITWDTSTAFATYKWIFGSPTVPPRLLTIPRSTNSLTLTLGQLDSILLLNGINQGDSLVGQWDVWAFRNNPPDFDSLKSTDGPRAVTLKRGIPQLSSFNLLSPSDGATIVTSPNIVTPINIAWSKSGEGVKYRWKFGSPTISTVILNVPSNNSGYDTVFTIINSALDAILTGLGLNPGDSINGQWAVWAYNATDSLKSNQTFDITLKRQGLGDILVVYDSTATNGRASRDSVVTVLSNLGVTFDLKNKGTITAGTIFSLRGYKKVMWLGSGTSTMSVAQRDSVKAYLNAGGTTAATKSKLIIFSEDIGYQHGRSGSTNLDLDLCNNYLGFNYVADRPGGTGYHGLIGMTINTGIADSTIGTWPDVLVQYGTGTDPLYRFRRHTAPDSINAIGKVAATFVAATFGSDTRSLLRAIDSPPGSAVQRFVQAALNYVDQVVIDVHDIGVFSLGSSQMKQESNNNLLDRQSMIDFEKQNNDEEKKDDLSVTENISYLSPVIQGPTVFDYKSPITLKAVVRNYGTYIENSYQVGWNIDGVLQTTVSNTKPLVIGGIDTLNLVWDNPTVGTHTARAWTILAIDSNYINDTSAVYNFEILAPNILLQEGFNGTTFPPTGWLTINRDGGGTSGPWFGATGPTPFTPYEGAGFAADNYESANGFYIDDYLITPNLGGTNDNMTFDSLTFWVRSPDNSQWADSLEIRVSTTGTNPNDFTILLDYFKVSITGWERHAYALPNAAVRYIAFRYLIYDGGPTGTNSNYVGLDDVRITRYTIPATGNWTAQTSGVTTALYTVKAVSSSIAWVGGAGGRVLRTTNGGLNWTSVGGGAIGTADIYAITALDANTAFVTTTPSTSTFLYRTTNGGSLWTQVFTQSGGFINAIHMFNANNGIAQGDPVGGTWTIIKTTDGGATWNRIATEPAAGTGEAGWNNSFVVVDNSHIWYGTNSSRIYKSADGGDNWTFNTVPFVNGYGIWFNDKENGVVAGDAAAKTTDGGLTWTAVPVPGTGSIYAVGGVGAPDYWLARSTGVYRSTNNGQAWNLEYTGVGTQNHLNFVAIGTTGWTIGSTGAIAKFSPPVGVSESQTELPDDFVLMQNYPNPFNPSTTINYGLPENAVVKLEVFNILGQRITVIVNTEQKAGYHSVVFNNEGLASGLYFYRLEARGISNSQRSFIQIRKMLLVR